MKLIKQVISFIIWSCLGFFAAILFSVVALVVVFVAKSMGEQNLSVDQIKHPGRAVGVVELTGEIFSSKDFREQLRKRVDNDKLQAIVVRIDTPGGAVGASEEMYRAIKEADAKKPVVCSLGNIAASGGLYAAVGCRKVVVNEGTLSGSIGVIFMMPNVEQIADKLGFSMNVIKTGQFKDTGSPFRSLTEPERELLQSLLDQTYEQFIGAIAEGRGLSVDAVRKFADGRIILGEQAVELGLADQIGGLEDAARLALSIAKPDEKGEPEIIMPSKPKNFLSLMEDLREVKLTDRLRAFTEPRLLFRAPY